MCILTRKLLTQFFCYTFIIIFFFYIFEYTRIVFMYREIEKKKQSKKYFFQVLN